MLTTGSGDSSWHTSIYKPSASWTRDPSCGRYGDDDGLRSVPWLGTERGHQTAGETGSRESAVMG